MPTDTQALDWLKACLRGDKPCWPDDRDAVMAEEIRQVGMEHGVLALCANELINTSMWETLPPAFQEYLREHVRQVAVVENVKKHEIMLVLEKMHEEGITPLLMKGAHLAYNTYPQPYLRPRSDTDLLFPDKNTAERAWSVVQKMGYSRPNAVSGEFVSHEFACCKRGKSGIQHTFDCHWKINNNQVFANTFSYR